MKVRVEPPTALLARGLHTCLRLALCGLAMTSFSRRAEAEAQPEKVSERAVVFANDKNWLRATVSYRDALVAPLVAKLSSGLPMIIAARTYVLAQGDSTPVALSVRSCRVVYDLWDEVYRIRVTERSLAQTSPDTERDIAGLNVEGVLRQCTDLREWVVAEKRVLVPGKPYFLGFIVEINPVSAELVAELRRWVARPAGATGIGPGDALFGSFVSLFLQKLGTADRTLRFRSQTFTL
jgi:hypothetical protein